jgi:hypothetical protein
VEIVLALGLTGLLTGCVARSEASAPDPTFADPSLGALRNATLAADQFPGTWTPAGDGESHGLPVDRGSGAGACAADFTDQFRLGSLTRGWRTDATEAESGIHAEVVVVADPDALREVRAVAAAITSCGAPVRTRMYGYSVVVRTVGTSVGRWGSATSCVRYSVAGYAWSSGGAQCVVADGDHVVMVSLETVGPGILDELPKGVPIDGSTPTDAALTAVTGAAVERAAAVL